MRVGGGVILKSGDFLFPLFEIEGVVQVSGVGTNSIVPAQILGPNHFLAVKQAFMLFFAVPRADDADFRLGLEHGF